MVNKKIKEKYKQVTERKKKMLTFAKEKARINILCLSYMSFIINEVSINIIKRKILYLKSIDFRIKFP